MELRSLAYFTRIAELGSITRAASHLRLAQPALTRHVQRLEEELGVALFQNRAELGRCSQTCRCAIYGHDVEVPHLPFSCNY